MYCVYNTNIVYILIIYVVDVNIYSTYYLDIEKIKWVRVKVCLFILMYI